MVLEYGAGRLSAHLPLATRLLLLKVDGSVLVHSDSLSYKPLNWMSRAEVCISPSEAILFRITMSL